MPKYEVEIREIEVYRIVVEADCEADAEDKAWEMLTDGTNKDQYHNDSDGEARAVEL